MSDLEHIRKWLRPTSRSIDADAVDRIADVIMEGMIGMSGAEPNVAAKLMALIKVMAMMLAAVKTSGRPDADRSVQDMIDGIGPALAAEMVIFAEAAAKDERRAARALRSVARAG